MAATPSSASSPMSTYSAVPTENIDISTAATSPVDSDIPQEHTEAVVVDAVNKKKKKKKKSKKPGKPPSLESGSGANGQHRSNVLCISRNKHWRYISSYHGPWLQLPVELLQSLLTLNLNPASWSDESQRIHNSFSSNSADSYRSLSSRGASRHRLPSIEQHPLDPIHPLQALPPIPPIPTDRPVPPPIDPAVFNAVVSIRRLIDEAAELAVRASSGLSNAALAASTLSFNDFPPMNNGRMQTMSPARIHRLRALAVQKLAQAYKLDEVASSVMVMQGGTVFDDIAERVLKYDPNNIDAKYVHFFHEKIPSRHLAESTTTQCLDELITAQPYRLEFYRTRGIVRGFCDDYPSAVRDFTFALREARAHRPPPKTATSNSKKKKKKNAQMPLTPSPSDDVEEAQTPSSLGYTPDPMEPQLLFLRAGAYMQHAIYSIENAILDLEDIRRLHGHEVRLCDLEDGRYGGLHPTKLLGPRQGGKHMAYRAILAEPALRSRVDTLLRKSVRDYERFLAHYESVAGLEPAILHGADLATRTAYAFQLSESIRPGNLRPAETPAVYTTYHPLLVEAHFSILLCQLLLAEFSVLLNSLATTAALVDGLEGYPVFLPPRSMAQAEFVEVLERLTVSWEAGVLPHSQSHPIDDHVALAIKHSSTMLLPPVLSRAISSSSSSSSAPIPGPCSASGSSTPLRLPEVRGGVELDCARMLLAPVAQRQKERAQEKSLATPANQNATKGPRAPLNINVPLHGPRVDVILAWLEAVHLPELEGVA